MNKEYVYIGKIVNTHGIKGELRLLSDFEKKEKVFKENMNIYIGEEKQQECIRNYRHHKNFDMITLKNYSNINEVLKYKNKKVFVKRESLHLQANEYLYEDLIGLDVYEKQDLIGKIKEIVYNNANILLYIEAERDFYIPLQDFFIKHVDLTAKRIEVSNVKGLML